MALYDKVKIAKAEKPDIVPKNDYNKLEMNCLYKNQKAFKS